MNKKRSRKAFTIVELVIVIAVIALIATVLVPTFGDVIQKANDSKAMQMAKNTYTSYIIENPEQAGELFVYESDGCYVAIKNGSPAEIFNTQEEAIAALAGENVASYLPIKVADGLVLMQYEENLISLQYDDRYDVSGKTLEIINPGQPTSYKIGAAAGTLDDAVITKNGNVLIATGIGIAQVKIDGVLYQVRVTPAPISLFMITGHSMGQGAKGDAAKSVICPDGQAYSSYGTDNLGAETEDFGISYAASHRANDINAFTEAGNGTKGEGSALAWQWNQLTGEKVWILNAAVGGSNLKEWISGTTNYKNAVTQFQRAQAILSNEIKAGHYTLSSMGIFYHSGANFANKLNPTQNDLQTWYASMWGGFKEDLCKDMDGDGTTETVSFLGIVPFCKLEKGKAFLYDEPAGLYMAASAEYPDIFIASLIGQEWLTDADVAANFPEISYQTQNGQALARPTTTEGVFDPVKVHYQQVGYNAVGIDIANNLYTKLKGEKVAPKITVYYPVDDGGMAELGDNIKLTCGQSLLLSPVMDPIAAGDLTFTVSGCIQLEYPLQIVAKKSGTGTLSISYNGTVLEVITFTVE